MESKRLINREAGDTTVVELNLACGMLILVRVIWNLNLHKPRNLRRLCLFGLGKL